MLKTLKVAVKNLISLYLLFLQMRKFLNSFNFIWIYLWGEKKHYIMNYFPVILWTQVTEKQLSVGHTWAVWISWAQILFFPNLILKIINKNMLYDPHIHSKDELC